jgi:AcrR family transcriptional regulator
MYNPIHVTQASNLVNMNRRPRGAEEVRAALLRAARRRFADEGPAASLRDIAADAQVNIGLIHHYFGNKAELLGAVMTDLVERAQQGAQPFASFDEVLELLLAYTTTGDPGSNEYVRIVAWLLLAGENPRDYQQEFSLPSVAELAGREHRGLLLLLLTTIFGWGIFGSHLSSLVGYDTPTTAANDLTSALQQIATTGQPAPPKTKAQPSPSSSKPSRPTKARQNKNA